MKKLIYLLLIFALSSCLVKDNPSPEELRLKGYTLKFDAADKLNIFTNEYVYDDNNLLTDFIEYDTIFYHDSKTFDPSQAITHYEYDNKGFLIKRTRTTLSIVSNIESEIEYTYLNDRLLLEKTGNRLAEYQYDTEGRLKAVISQSLTNGIKTVTEYLDDVPKSWTKTANGFEEINGNTKTIYNSSLLPTLAETTENGMITYRKTNEYVNVEHPFKLIPEFKGFPKIRQIWYRNGIDQFTRTFKLSNSTLKLSDERTMNEKLEKNGLLSRTDGNENVNLLTSGPISRTVTYAYYYERK